MADTGENRQITSRANAKEGETVRESAKIIAQELSAGRANSAAFVRSPRGSRYRTKAKTTSGTGSKVVDCPQPAPAPVKR